MYNVKCTVKSIKGDCGAGYEIGDHFFIKDMAMIEAGKPKGICLHALTAMITYLTAYCRKTDESDWINMIQELQCPDSTNSVVFSLQRQ
ncbi:MAG: TIGR04076 family protein [Desulfobacteraceae bacterium]|nr:TIGR04076 family protein [Desulfobacteraceae bacterium]